jgi:serine/threonine protein kinase
MDIGQIIQQRYQIESLLGQGGMGTTYKALDLKTQRPVAVKVLNFSRMQEWKPLEMFEREAKILQQLTHPQIPAYIDYFSEETATDVHFVLVQEYIEGKTLQQLVEEGWRGTESEILDIFRQLVAILEYLHTLHPPVVHRDINPKNIILASENKVYLVDFGAVQERIRTTFLGTSTVVGTFGYVPFEQFSGQAVPASDYYALGATLLYLLTHRHPADFQTEELKPKFRDVLDASPAILRLLDGLLEPSVEKRVASPEAVEAILQGKTASLQKHLSESPLPYGTTIKKIDKGHDHIQFRIPGKVGLGSLLILGFSIFWLTFVTVWTAMAPIGSGFFALFSIPFWIVGLGMFSTAMYNLFGRTTLDLTPEWTRVSYTLVGLGFSQRVPTASVEKLDVSTWYSKNNQPVEGITIYAGAKTLKLGSQLTKAEKDWLIEHIEDYVLTYAQPLLERN